MEERRTEIYIPYEEKEDALKLGAKWDSNTGCWYATKENIYELSQRWKINSNSFYYNPSKEKEISKNMEIRELVEEKSTHYLGMKLGKFLYGELDKANESIKVITPSIDLKNVEYLLNLKRKGISIELIFSNIEREKDKLLPLLFFGDTRTFIEIKRLLLTSKILRLLSIFSFISLVSFNGFEYINSNSFYEYSLILGVASLLFLAIDLSIKKKTNKKLKRPSNIDFKYLKNYRNSNLTLPPVSSNIYIVDDKTLLTGSMSLTSISLESNFESLIKFRENSIVNTYIKEFEKIKEFPVFSYREFI